ncbi:hypothetical protein M911_06445 [Ectothiorhodospira haloalkaliphila]|uniref:Uncharacterized protein n=2 Tax=Ectothiorhodospira haloalkaliphila TaxID=421628 RepID=W8KNE0_9GAMM|nr:hypothetical protein M911_06445 [Ectothiorhodospira haloalkaliphila]
MVCAESSRVQGVPGFDGVQDSSQSGFTPGPDIQCFCMQFIGQTFRVPWQPAERFHGVAGIKAGSGVGKALRDPGALGRGSGRERHHVRWRVAGSDLTRLCCHHHQHGHDEYGPAGRNGQGLRP